MRIGIDLGGTKIEAILLDGQGREVLRKRIKAPKNVYSETIKAISDLVAGLESQVGLVKPASVGVGIPGTISPKSGLVKNANSTWLIGHPLDRDLADALRREVRLANDANCFALSEATDGAGAGAKVVFGVILGTGVGGGLVIDQQVLSGPNAIAGEWGHNPLPWPQAAELPGSPCYCGLSGCIETFLNGAGLVLEYQSLGGYRVESADEINGLQDSDPIAALAIERYCQRLARALASVINIVDPDVIVLGGGLSNIQQLYQCVPEIWGQWIFSDEADTRLVPNKHGDSSGVRGAAWLWPQRPEAQ